MEECYMQVKELQEEKEHIERSQRAIDPKYSETNNLIEEAQKTVREFHNALGAELATQPEPRNVIGQMSSNADIITFLMDFLTKVKKLPEVVAGERTDPGHQVMYEGELQKLSQPNQERFYNLAQLLEKAYKVADEGNDQISTFEAFFKRNEETRGPLMTRVKEVKKKH